MRHGFITPDEEQNGKPTVVDAEGRHVTRMPQPGDRRRNVIELTASGRTTLDRAVLAWDTAEKIFLANIDAQSAEQFRAFLRQIVDTPAHVRP